MANNETITISLDDYTFSIEPTNDLDTLGITFDGQDWGGDSITWEQIEFEDTMPEIVKVKNMCSEYPALAKAYENFKTIYKMVDQDYLGKQKEIN
tara:strand:+ start:117 stop:401 length:285 start_codon:yes stop_codon:yes gene_type:complete